MTDEQKRAFARAFAGIEFSEHDAALRIFVLGWRAHEEFVADSAWRAARETIAERSARESAHD